MSENLPINSESEETEPVLSPKEKIRLFFFGRMSFNDIMEIRKSFGAFLYGLLVLFTPVLGFILLAFNLNVVYIIFILSVYPLFLVFLRTFIEKFYGTSKDQLNTPITVNGVKAEVNQQILDTLNELDLRKNMYNEAKDLALKQIDESLKKLGETTANIINTVNELPTPAPPNVIGEVTVPTEEKKEGDTTPK